MYGTDKGIGGHNYIPFYEKYLPKNPKSILEIGVFKGASMNMWRKHFPEADLHGLDLFKENEVPNIEGVTWHIGNQCDWQTLERLRAFDFDVIIDDGSHNSRDQMITFFGLFNGKHYFIEDLHCNYDIPYTQGLPFPTSARELFGNDHLEGLETIKSGNIILIKCS